MNSLNLNGKLISADDKNIQYMGRIDFTDTKAPLIIYAGSSIKLKFTGTSISCIILNHKYYNIMELGYILDGIESKIQFDTNDVKFELKLAENLEDKEHEIILFKRQDATHYFEFFGFVIEQTAKVLVADEPKDRRIECFGDSVSAGAVCEATDRVGQVDPDNTEGVFDNSWHSYSMITARNLGAEIHNNSQGGIALFDGTGYYHAPNHIGLESTWDKLCYFPEGGISYWDFKRYIPHVVIMAIGQNDSNREGFPPNNISEPEYRKKWKTKYKEIVLSLRQNYPKATFILTTTLLMHDSDWDNAIEEIKNELSDNKIHHFMYKRNGSATPGHPRIQEQREMSEELTAFISRLGDSIWE